MITPPDGDTAATDRARTARGSWALSRWLLSYATFSVPQAAGPIAFALVALPLTGSPRSGATLVLAITLAQVVGAIPVARLGRDRNAVLFLKGLVIIRTLALAAVAVLAASGTPFGFLLAAAALAGLVNGAAFGFLRSVLNHLVAPSRMPRALGLASTLSEFTFVAAPVLASVLGAVNPVAGLLLLAVLGAATVFLVPNVPQARASASPDRGGRLLTPAILLWLGCALANSVAVSSVEIGAVSLAMRYGFEPAQGFIFTVALCVASVAGGIWVSVRNRVASLWTIVGWLAAMGAGAALVAAGSSVATTLAGAAMIGGVMAPLSTSYSLRLDALSPPHRKAELFALSRTATAVGIILSTTTLTLTSLVATQVVAAAVVCAACAAVGIASMVGAR